LQHTKEAELPQALTQESISNILLKAELAISEKYPDISLSNLSILEFKYVADTRPDPRYTVSYKIIGTEKSEKLPAEGISKTRKTIESMNVTLNVKAEVISVSKGTKSSFHSVLKQPADAKSLTIRSEQ